MAQRTIEIDSNQVTDLNLVPLGGKITLMLTGKVVTNQNGQALIAIESVLGRPAEPEDAMNEMVSLNRPMRS